MHEMETTGQGARIQLLNKLSGCIYLRSRKLCYTFSRMLLDFVYLLFKGGNYEEIRYIDIQYKVEKNLKGSLDSIPAPSVKIQVMGGKVCLGCKGKTLLGVVKKLFVLKSSSSNVLPYYLKQTFLPTF